MNAAEKQRLEEDWLKEARLAYQRAFPDDAPRRGATFLQLEQEAMREGDLVARLILERKLQAEGSAKEQSQSAPCPHCGKPARLQKTGAQRRELITKMGRVGFDRLGLYCPSCRKAFFPSGPSARSAR